MCNNLLYYNLITIMIVSVVAIVVVVEIILIIMNTHMYVICIYIYIHTSHIGWRRREGRRLQGGRGGGLGFVLFFLSCFIISIALIIVVLYYY